MDNIPGTTTTQNNGQGDSIQVNFLCQGCQTADSVAQELARFINQATQTLDISIYSFYLGESTRQIVVSALENRASSGVGIRIAYDAATQQAQLPGYSMGVHRQTRHRSRCRRFITRLLSHHPQILPIL